jgi:hypothetical protein
MSLFSFILPPKAPSPMEMIAAGLSKPTGRFRVFTAEEQAARARFAAKLPTRAANVNRNVYAPAPPRFTVTTPNNQFKGKRQGIEFVDGVGHTGDPVIAEVFRRDGYGVTEDQSL